MQIDDENSGFDTQDWPVDELGRVVAELAGIADVEIDLREDGSPHIRVKLDGSVSSAEVGAAIRQAVAAAKPAETVDENGLERKAGLGKGLGELLAAHAEASMPSQLKPATAEREQMAQPHLTLVAVEETAGGVSVRVSDSDGGISFSPVADPRSLNQAIVSAVARLRRVRPTPRLAGVEIRDVEGHPILNVVLILGDGDRAVGAAVVEGGMPFTLGKAVWEALATVD